MWIKEPALRPDFWVPASKMSGPSVKHLLPFRAGSWRELCKHEQRSGQWEHTQVSNLEPWITSTLLCPRMEVYLKMLNWVCLLPSQAISLQCGTGVTLLFWLSLVHLVTLAHLAIHLPNTTGWNTGVSILGRKERVDVRHWFLLKGNLVIDFQGSGFPSDFTNKRKKLPVGWEV